MDDPKPILDVNVVILQDGIFLRTKRRDFKVWCLQGGKVKAGEPLTQAAMREARES